MPEAERIINIHPAVSSSLSGDVSASVQTMVSRLRKLGEPEAADLIAKMASLYNKEDTAKFIEEFSKGTPPPTVSDPDLQSALEWIYESNKETNRMTLSCMIAGRIREKRLR